MGFLDLEGLGGLLALAGAFVVDVVVDVLNLSSTEALFELAVEWVGASTAER